MTSLSSNMQLSDFYLSHQLVGGSELKFSHMGKNRLNIDLVYKKGMTRTHVFHFNIYCGHEVHVQDKYRADVNLQDNFTSKSTPKYILTSCFEHGFSYL